MIRWTPENRAAFAGLYRGGATLSAIRAALPGLTNGAIAGQAIRMQLHRPSAPQSVRGLSSQHPAVVDGHTMFPTRVREAAAAPNLLAPGAWQRKLGAVITKGAWSGFPIYALTLEERATCPRECHNWATCMGNGMQAAWRNRHGVALERTLDRELAALQREHPGGFAVRLHILGDFYSVDYVRRWGEWIDRFPALHVFGFTAWDWLTDIGAAVAVLAFQRWDRFAVRLSSREPGLMRAVTLYDDMPSPRPDVIVCPAATGKTRGCNTCGLCWAPAARKKTIAFIAHGPAWEGRPPNG